MSEEQSLAAWRHERNEALKNLDIEYARKVLPAASSDEVLLITLHKSRYECVDIPKEFRHSSAAWLRGRGYGGMCGPLLPEGELPS